MSIFFLIGVGTCLWLLGAFVWYVLGTLQDLRKLRGDDVEDE